MRIAYIILAHRFPEQLIRLVRRLDAPGVHFYIHIDRKADMSVYDRIVEALGPFTNVHLLERFVCHWGCIGHLQGTLAGIHRLLEDGYPFDYLLLLTGQDYPLHSNAQIAATLERAGGRSFLEFHPLPWERWVGGGLDRLRCWNFRTNLGKRRLLTFPSSQECFRSPALTLLWRGLCRLFPFRRQVPLGLTPYGGSAYWGLARPCVEYVAEFVRRNPQFVRFFKYAGLPEEVFFQTILANSPHCDSLINQDLHFVDWEHPNPTLPAVLESADIERLLTSGDLFARKFEMQRDARIFDLLDSAVDHSISSRL